MRAHCFVYWVGFHLDPWTIDRRQLWDLGLSQWTLEFRMSIDRVSGTRDWSIYPFLCFSRYFLACTERIVFQFFRSNLDWVSRQKLSSSYSPSRLIWWSIWVQPYRFYCLQDRWPWDICHSRVRFSNLEQNRHQDCFELELVGEGRFDSRYAVSCDWLSEPGFQVQLPKSDAQHSLDWLATAWFCSLNWSLVSFLGS